MSALVVVDGPWLCCSLWWSNPSEVVARFERTIEKIRPAKADVVVAWDDPAGSWRREVYPEYKSGRPLKPGALIQAMKDCRHVYPHQWARSLEADDLAARLVRDQGGRPIVLFSRDRDWAQLVSPTCFQLAGDELLKVDGVIAKHGVAPHLIPNLLSFTGDKSDNLPGVPGYGPKRAIPRALAGEIGDELTYDLVTLT